MIKVIQAFRERELPDSEAVLRGNLASFFLSPFMQLHEKMIREDGSLGRCRNHDTEEEPGGRLPLGATSPLHPSLEWKVGLGGAQSAGEGHPEGKRKLKIGMEFCFLLLFKKIFV